MAKLSDVINTIKAKDGYKHHLLRGKDYKGGVHRYTFWFEKDDEVRDYEVRILVVDEGLETEQAYLYRFNFDSSTQFEKDLSTAITSYLTNNKSYDKIVPTSIDNKNEVAGLQLYRYNSTNKEEEIVSGLALRVGKNIEVRRKA